jgi:Domain of unknown function (DUF397)
MNSPDLSRVAWRKSSHSGANGSCVEVAPVPGAALDGTALDSTALTSTGSPPGMIAVRDSKNRSGPALVFTARQWRTFAAGVKAGELDLA